MKKLPQAAFGLLTFLLLLGAGNAKGQLIDNLFVAATNESMAFPFTRYFPIHPGLEIGTTLWRSEGERSLHRANVFVGGYTHRRMENGLYLRGEYAYTYKLRDILGIDLPLGLGYMHAFYPGVTYAQNPEDGTWAEARQIGKPHGLVTGGFGFTLLKSDRFQPFVRQETAIDLPLYNGFVSIKTFVKIGLDIKFN